MLNFVIYEDVDRIRERYINLVHKFMGKNNIMYRIYPYECYCDQLHEVVQNKIGKKIYILDIEVPGKSGIDLAREIRFSGDWESQIIIVTSHDEMREGDFRSKILMLNFISKYNNCEKELYETLELAHTIVDNYKSLNFQQDGEVYRIPYNDILYIEKDLDDNYSKIIMSNDIIIRKQPIIKIMNALESDRRFLRTHRSCIVNTYNIQKVDLVNNLITFVNGATTALLSRNHKKELKDRIMTSR